LFTYYFIHRRRHFWLSRNEQLMPVSQKISTGCTKLQDGLNSFLGFNGRSKAPDYYFNRPLTSRIIPQWQSHSKLFARGSPFGPRTFGDARRQTKCRTDRHVRPGARPRTPGSRCPQKKDRTPSQSARPSSDVRGRHFEKKTSLADKKWTSPRCVSLLLVSFFYIISQQLNSSSVTKVRRDTKRGSFYKR